ncbi:MAG TPA: DNA ligase, partial [Myxococcota bacterium]
VEAEAERLGALPEAIASTAAPKKTKTVTTTTTTADGETEEVESEGPPVLLAHKWESDVDLTGWWLSEKLDGVRAYWDGERFISRLGNPFYAPAWFTEGLPKHALDGELWLARQEFQRCVSIVRRQDAGPEWKQLRFIIFDAPHLTTPFEERIAWMQTNFADGSHPYARALEQVVCTGIEHVKAELARVEALGGEGLMMRQPGSRYEAGRSHTLLKVKTFHDAEARVVEHEGGKGKHKGRLGALVCVSDTGKRFNVGTGFTDAEREDPPAVGEIITYRYQELTKDGVPRFPSYVGRAIDKATPTAAATTPVPAPKVAPTTAPTTAPKPATETVAAPVAAKAVVTPPAPPPPTIAASTSTAPTFIGTEQGVPRFWRVEVDGASHTVFSGKRGTAGQERTKTFASSTLATADAARLTAEKVAAGYVLESTA